MYPEWDFDGQVHEGRKGLHSQSAASAGRFPAVSAHFLALVSYHPRD